MSEKRTKPKYKKLNLLLLFHQDSFERISFVGEKKISAKTAFFICYFLSLVFSQVYEWLNDLLGNSNRKQAECEMVFSRFGKSLDLHPVFWDLTNKLIDDWNHFSFDHFLFLYNVASGGTWAKPNVSTSSKNVKFGGGGDIKGNLR